MARMINGMVVEGFSMDEIAELMLKLQQKSVSSTKSKSDVAKTSTSRTKTSKDVNVNELPFNDDLRPSKPKKTTGKKGGNKLSFEDYIQLCIEGKKVYPSETVSWKNEIMHIKGIGYICCIVIMAQQRKIKIANVYRNGIVNVKFMMMHFLEYLKLYKGRENK